MDKKKYLYFSKEYLSKNKMKMDEKIYCLQHNVLEGIIEFDEEILAAIKNSRSYNNQINKDYYNFNKQTLTCAIIVKNEEEYIERCIESVIDMCEEIVIVDTGSTDQTMNIIKKFTSTKIKIYTQKWQDDFSSVRNYALEKVTSDWVFFIDSDEYIDETTMTKERFKELLISLNNLPDIHTTAICPQIEDSRNGDIVIEVKRIFKVNPKIKYYGLIHEEPRLNNNEMNLISIKLLIKHDGYKEDIFLKKDKINRNFELIKKMIKIEKKNKRWVYFYLRDGFSMMDKEEIMNILLSNIKLDLDKPLVKDNLQIDAYTFAFVDMLAALYLSTNNEKLLLEAIECMNFIMPDNSNSIYYYNINKIRQLKIEFESMLQHLLKYRSNNFSTEYGTINSNGSHIDFLIGILLFETGNFKNSFEYLNHSKNTFNEPEILKYYEAVRKSNFNEKN